jgi:hypothetical protein
MVSTKQMKIGFQIIKISAIALLALIVFNQI